MSTNTFLLLSRKCVLFSVLLLMTSMASAAKFVTKVSGGVEIALPGGSRPMAITSGTLLPSDATVVFAKNSKISVLCTSAKKVISLSSSEQFAKACSSDRKMDTYRSSAEDKAPVLLFPNQTTLSKIDKIVWGGPAKTYYEVVVYKKLPQGGEEAIYKSGQLALRPHNLELPIFTHKLKNTLNLSFENSVQYEVVVTNLKRKSESRDAALPPDIISKPNRSASPTIVPKFSGNQNLKTLAKVATLSSADFRYEASMILESVDDSYRAQKHMLNADLLLHPSIPFDYAAQEYVRTIEAAHEAKDTLNAFLACRELQSDPLLFKKWATKLELSIPKEQWEIYCPE